MRSRTIAIISSIAALSFVAAPVAAIAATSHSTVSSAQQDRSRDIRGVQHRDTTPDRHSADSPRDKRDR